MLQAQGNEEEVEALKSEISSLVHKPATKEEDPKIRVDVAAKTLSWLVTSGDSGAKGKLIKLWTELMSKSDHKDGKRKNLGLLSTWAFVKIFWVF